MPDLSKTKKMHVVIVCHTEMLSGSWAVFERMQPRIDELLSKVAEETGKQPKMTYCATEDFLSDRLDDAFRYLEEGHEVGIHSHLPGCHGIICRYDGHYAHRLDERGVLNQDAVAGPLRQIAIALGLPAPKTHVSGYFTFQQTTIRVLSEAGFTVDCSLTVGGKSTKGDFVLVDSTGRTDPHPYRPDLLDPLVSGHSPIIELPLSGWIGGGNIDGDIACLRERLVLPDRELDVFHTHWHHFEFADLGWTKESLADFEKFLLECASHDNVVFSTASEAAADLERHGL